MLSIDAAAIALVMVSSAAGWLALPGYDCWATLHGKSQTGPIFMHQ